MVRTVTWSTTHGGASVTQALVNALAGVGARPAPHLRKRSFPFVARSNPLDGRSGLTSRAGIVTYKLTLTY